MHLFQDVHYSQHRDISLLFWHIVSHIQEFRVSKIRTGLYHAADEVAADCRRHREGPLIFASTFDFHRYTDRI